jgi:hypothetical protein
MPGTEFNGKVARYNDYLATDKLFPVDEENTTIVVPEIGIDILNNFQKSRKCLWWLAAGWHVDAGLYDNLVQSEFAAQLVRDNGSIPIYLSDYTMVPRNPPQIPNTNGVIAYNASRGAEYVLPVIERLAHFRWVGLAGMSREQVYATLSEATIYLDLGHHPGKDRMPREAAIRGAITVTGTRGSSGFFEDVPISEKVDGSDPGGVVRLLELIMESPGQYYKKQEPYRTKIVMEKEVFDTEVRKAFKWPLT